MLKTEYDADLSFDFDRLPVEDVRLIPPLLHGTDGGWHQEWMTTQCMQLGDASLGVDYRCEKHRPLGVADDRNLRIDRLYLLDEQAGVEMRYRNALMGRGDWRRSDHWFSARTEKVVEGRISSWRSSRSGNGSLSYRIADRSWVGREIRTWRDLSAIDDVASLHL